MGKKSKAAKKNTESPGKNPVPWVIAVIVAVVAALAISGNLPFMTAEKETGKSLSKRNRTSGWAGAGLA